MLPDAWNRLPATSQNGRSVNSAPKQAVHADYDPGRWAEEVRQHLSTLPGARVEVEVQVHVAEDVSDDTVRTVTENADTLKFDSHGFERE